MTTTMKAVSFFWGVVIGGLITVSLMMALWPSGPQLQGCGKVADLGTTMTARPAAGMAMYADKNGVMLCHTN
jgi:hypothetical protein